MSKVMYPPLFLPYPSYCSDRTPIISDYSAVRITHEPGGLNDLAVDVAVPLIIIRWSAGYSERMASMHTCGIDSNCLALGHLDSGPTAIGALAWTD